MSDPDAPAGDSENPPTPAGTRWREQVVQTLQPALLRTAWHLLAQHWWRLLAIALCGYVGRHYLIELGVLVGGTNGVLGMLMFCLIPLVPVIATVAMLLTLRQRADSRGSTALIVGIGSVLVPFLVVYDSSGQFDLDITIFFQRGYEADLPTTFEGGNDALERIPEPSSLLVLGIVAVTLLLRTLGVWVVNHPALWGRRGQIRTVLRFVIGYAEVVWIVLGAMVVREAFRQLSGWWGSRRAGHGLIAWWEEVEVSLPWIANTFGWLWGAVLTVTDGIVTGLVTPLGWLAVGVVVYGVVATSAIDEREVVEFVGRGRAAGRLNPALVGYAWRRIAAPDSRFGALFGAIAMILRSAFAPVMVYAIVYTVLQNGLPYLVWALARSTGVTLDSYAWAAWYVPLNLVIEMLLQMLSAVLLAVYADALLQQFGAPSSLRLAGVRPIRRLQRRAQSSSNMK